MPAPVDNCEIWDIFEAEAEAVASPCHGTPETCGWSSEAELAVTSTRNFLLSSPACTVRIHPFPEVPKRQRLDTSLTEDAFDTSEMPALPSFSETSSTFALFSHSLSSGSSSLMITGIDGTSKTFPRKSNAASDDMDFDTTDRTDRSIHQAVIRALVAPTASSLHTDQKAKRFARQNVRSSGGLWSQIFAPLKFTELVTADHVNKEVLQWLLSWKERHASPTDGKKVCFFHFPQDSHITWTSWLWKKHPCSGHCRGHRVFPTDHKCGNRRRKCSICYGKDYHWPYHGFPCSHFLVRIKGLFGASGRTRCSTCRHLQRYCERYYSCSDKRAASSPPHCCYMRRSMGVYFKAAEGRCSHGCLHCICAAGCRAAARNSYCTMHC